MADTFITAGPLSLVKLRDLGDSTYALVIDPAPAGQGAEVASASFTRPNDTTAYLANDAMADSTSAPTNLEFTLGRENGGAGQILSALCVLGGNQATKPSLRLFLFDTEPTAVNDNAPFTLSDAQAETLIGYVDFNNWIGGDDTADAGGNAVCVAQLANPIAFECGAASQKVFGRLKVLSAYTPLAQMKLTFRLGEDQD